VDYRVGWNVIADGPHERFTWIDPTGTQPGLTTYERPTTVPESEIYRQPEHPPFDPHGCPRVPQSCPRCPGDR